MIPALFVACFLPAFLQDTPSSRATSRPARPSAMNARMVPAEWPDDAPGQQVAPYRWLPIKNAPYCGPAEAGQVRDRDIVIGLEVGGKAYAYPIKMLGGPQREIINEEIGGKSFAVNW